MTSNSGVGAKIVAAIPKASPFFADQNQWSATSEDRPTQLEFYTTADVWPNSTPDTYSGLKKRMVISSSGNVGINKDWPMATLDLDGTIKVNSSSLTNNLNPTLANRALMLDQSDFIVYKTLDDVAFNGEVDGDVTNEIQNLSFNSSIMNFL